jgi:mutual gliding-motility protein MglA
MAFFNYSTMQMTAKIVYYGPGLGGKTTNLEFIHKHTTDDSRGEMVSLQTQSDRTLFFDLLPMEVGTIAGFRTRIQLYTVPGQVFYNTTRKLVLKGVDGVVFVADSQRPMLQANKESLHNLGENLATLGRSTDNMPLVLQYNKSDLEETCDVDELNEALNDGDWPHFQASALFGDGVFETLQGITRLTLLSLKKQLETSSGVGPGGHLRPSVPPPSALGEASAASRPARPATAPAESVAADRPIAADSAPEDSAPEAAPPAAAPPGEALEVEPVAATAADVEVASGNGHPPGGVDLAVELGRPELSRSRRVLIDLRFHDDQDRIVHEIRDLHWDLSKEGNLEELLVRLSISARAEE